MALDLSSHHVGSDAEQNLKLPGASSCCGNIYLSPFLWFMVYDIKGAPYEVWSIGVGDMQPDILQVMTVI